MAELVTLPYYFAVTLQNVKIYLTKKTIKNVKTGYVSTGNVDILNSLNSELQLKNTESVIKNKLKDLLSKFVTALVMEFKKIESDDATKDNTFYSNSKAETIINESDIDNVFESIYCKIISNIQKSIRKGSGWIIDSIINHTISISKYIP